MSDISRAKLGFSAQFYVVLVFLYKYIVIFVNSMIHQFSVAKISFEVY